jgi:hypothetical protein
MLAFPAKDPLSAPPCDVAKPLDWDAPTFNLTLSSGKAVAFSSVLDWIGTDDRSPENDISP